MGTWPHWHPLKGILSCLVLGDHLTELASSTFSSHLPVCTELFTLCALQGPLSVTQCHLCPAGRLETSFSYSGFLEFLVALAFHFWTSENPANVLVLFPDPGCLFSSVDPMSCWPQELLQSCWFLEEKAQDQGHSTNKQALCHPVYASFQPWNPLNIVSVLSNVPPLAHP